MKNETVIVREVCDYLSDSGYFFWRCNNIPVFGRALPKYTPRGLPDIFIVWRGILIGLECKREGSETEREANGRKIRAGKLSPDQADFAAKMVFNDAEYFTVHSVQEAKDYLTSLAIKRNFL